MLTVRDHLDQHRIKRLSTTRLSCKKWKNKKRKLRQQKESFIYLFFCSTRLPSVVFDVWDKKRRADERSADSSGSFQSQSEDQKKSHRCLPVTPPTGEAETSRTWGISWPKRRRSILAWLTFLLWHHLHNRLKWCHCRYRSLNFNCADHEGEEFIIDLLITDWQAPSLTSCLVIGWSFAMRRSALHDAWLYHD